VKVDWRSSAPLKHRRVFTCRCNRRACPVTLDRRDFVEALRDRPEPVDVAWISLSLHLALAKCESCS